MTSSNRIIIGTRGSALARTQALIIRRLLLERNPSLTIDISYLKTEGDIDRHSPLSCFGGRGAFVRTLENALLRREIDIAAHSLKDLPSRLPEGLALGAVPVREDPRDVLITHGGRNLQTLPIGAVISTGSERRRIQLAAMRPDIRFRDIRGNIETRILKVGSEGVDGVVLAYAGLKRLGIESRAEQVFSSEEMLPAPCQGALGAECRAEDKHALDLLRGIENYKIRACVDIERAFIAELGLGCHAPVAALAVFESGNICFEGLAGGRGGEIFRSRFSVPADRADEAALAMAAEMKKQMEI